MSGLKRCLDEGVSDCALLTEVNSEVDDSI